VTEKKEMRVQAGKLQAGKCLRKKKCESRQGHQKK
jgi:hypothetical protein